MWVSFCSQGKNQNKPWYPKSFFNLKSQGFLLWFLQKFFKFIYFERDRDSMSGGGAERERGERESQAGSALPAQSPTRGSNPWNGEIMTWAKTRSQMLTWQSRPGTATSINFLVVWGFFSPFRLFLHCEFSYFVFQLQYFIHWYFSFHLNLFFRHIWKVARLESRQGEMHVALAVLQISITLRAGVAS